MEIKSKYNINDVVWHISQDHPKVWVPCAACESTGSVVLKDGKSRSCPECYGRLGATKYEPQQWLVSGKLTIGLVRVEVVNFKSTSMFDNVGEYEGEGKQRQKTEYMAYETGIGSGKIYYESTLFSTQEEAQTECDKRNLSKE